MGSGRYSVPESSNLGMSAVQTYDVRNEHGWLNVLVRSTTSRGLRYEVRTGCGVGLGRSSCATNSCARSVGVVSMRRHLRDGDDVSLFTCLSRKSDSNSTSHAISSSTSRHLIQARRNKTSHIRNTEVGHSRITSSSESAPCCSDVACCERVLCNNVNRTVSPNPCSISSGIWKNTPRPQTHFAWNERSSRTNGTHRTRWTHHRPSIDRRSVSTSQI